MASNQIQMAVNFRKNINTKSAANGKYYAEVDRQKTLTTRGLAAHLKEHNCMVGRDAIQAVLVKLSECIPELVAQGVGVKLDGLGIFYPTIRNKKGGATEEQMLDSEFNPTSIVGGEAYGERQGEERAGGAEPGRLPHGQCAQQQWWRSAACRW